MLYETSRRLSLWKLAVVALFFLILGTAISRAQYSNVVTKLIDFDATRGYATPVGHVVPVGTNLWFFTQAGGTYTVGGVNSDITDLNSGSSAINVLASFDNSGKSPIGSLVIISNQGWFTSSLGGTGGKGALLNINLTNYQISNVYSFPTNLVYGYQPHGDVIQIGSDLWFLTASGGISQYGIQTNSRGTLVKYSLTNNTVSLMLSFDGTNYGAQPNGSLTQVGNAYYFTTFTGGANVTTTTPNGAGALDRLTFDTNGNPVITKVADMPEVACFPTATPTLVSNALWFTGAGSTTYPGALLRYDINSGTLSNMFLFTVASSTNYGKQAYSAVSVWNNELYLTTLTGGISNKGTILKYTISNNVMTKIVDLDGTGGRQLGSGQIYNSSQVVLDPITFHYYMNFLIKAGGAVGTGYGTMLAVSLAYQPITASITANATNGNATLSWVGGYVPFTLQGSVPPLSANSWTNLVTGLSTNTYSVPTTGSQQFFRVVGSPSP